MRSDRDLNAIARAMAPHYIRARVCRRDAIDVNQARRLANAEAMIGLHLLITTRAGHSVNSANNDVGRKAPPLARRTMRAHAKTLKNRRRRRKWESDRSAGRC